MPPQDEQTTVVTVDTPPDPSFVMQLATGYWASAALLAASEVGVFHALASGPATADEVAASLHADARALGYLIDALCGLNLVVKQGDRYMLPPVAQAFLVPGRPGSLDAGLTWARDQYAAWGRLAETVRTGRPAVDPALHLGADPGQTRAFVLAMHQRAIGVARGVTAFLEFDGATRLLDVGGGPGAYACLLAQKYPTLQVAVLDLPEIVAIASELIAQAGLATRVTTLAGDGATGDYGMGEYDAALFSGVLHQMSPAAIGRMLAGANRALQPGGRVAVCDVMVDAVGTQPVFATLFSLQMVLTTREGAVFSAESCQSWLEEAGFRDAQIRRLPPPMPYTIVSAVK